MAKDLAGAYVFYCDAYKKRVPRSEFLRMTRLTRFDLSDVRVAEVAGNTGRAQVTISFRLVLPVLSRESVESRATEWWARDDDQRWCKEDEPPLLPPASFRAAPPH